MKTKKIKITATVNSNETPANALYAALKNAINKMCIGHIVNVKNEIDCLFIDIDMKDDTIKDREIAEKASREITKDISAFTGQVAGYASLPSQEKDYIAQKNN